MPVPLRLAHFNAETEAEAPRALTPEEIADLRLSSYEQGYNSGWDDAQAQHDAQIRLEREVVARAIEQIRFTYEDARGTVERALEPVLRAMVTQVLPRAARHGLVPLVIEALQPMIEQARQSGLTLLVPPGQRGGFEAALAGLVLPALTLAEDDSLAEGTARIQSGATRLDIDPVGVAAAIAAAIDRHFQLLQDDPAPVSAPDPKPAPPEDRRHA
jgi:flagellar biosynthesis/type III secretory pathway protein FliH